MKSGSGETKFVQELILYAASAAMSCLVLVVGLKQLDPNRDAAKKAHEQKKDIAKRLGRPLIHTNSYEDVVACDVVNPDHMDVKFESIGGLDAIKQALYELVILPLRRPELFSHGKLLGPQKGVLLYGPPGTGKTMLAKAIAKESGAVFINVRISNLMSKWFGDAQKLVTAVFTLACKLQPAIIFIDEVDSFLGQRKSTDHEALTNMKTEFMALWDGFTTDQHARVMVMAATNRPSELDEAILRRLPQAFEIGLPNRKDRVAILKVVLKDEKVEGGIDYDRIATLCEGYTGSDLLELCKKAAYYPIRDLLEDEKSGKLSEEPRPISQSDLERVITSTTKTNAAASGYSSRSNSELLDLPTTDGSPVVGLALALSRCCCSLSLTKITSHRSGLVLGNCSAADPWCSEIAQPQTPAIDCSSVRSSALVSVADSSTSSCLATVLAAFRRRRVLPTSSSDWCQKVDRNSGNI
ncbi:P-loop containing nucleoside triphosphate hydrolases superfamily protein [Striga hermonthica]|uniref:P-loop containing nucleoside triphosphate hydrolases superfamily protein n=1 Tax=Striga hermonthica TaxID=68872 RepID=A0A9N7RP69_STRHE|nr:P-loop containing nucleoside triphosphate hydrolases superfamily protein [Striga hermonthica]